jgi:hypothetical protein
MALRGMPSYAAEPGSCAKAMPPSALIALTPRVPSEAVPDKITPMALLPCARASVRRKESIGMCWPRVRVRGTSFSMPPSSVTSCCPGVT